MDDRTLNRIIRLNLNASYMQSKQDLDGEKVLTETAASGLLNLSVTLPIQKIASRGHLMFSMQIFFMSWILEMERAWCHPFLPIIFLINYMP